MVSYPDIIASKLLTGKIPKAIKAFRFVPRGKQSNLSTITLFGKDIIC